MYLELICVCVCLASGTQSCLFVCFLNFIPVPFTECLSFLHCSYIRCLNMHGSVSVLTVVFVHWLLQLFQTGLIRDLLA